MKILTVIGARPQFIKAAPLSRLFKSKGIEEYLLHTGQHYDHNMSKIFFDDLKIPPPNLNLSIGSASQSKQTGLMLIEIEKVVEGYQPDWVVVYGDTNSTLAGALVASKLNIKIAHVESGLWSFDKRMPEEINRVLTDNVSDLLCCPSKTSVDQLEQEGIIDGVKLTGDIMHDAFLFDLDLASKLNVQFKDEQKFALLTLHRPSNTDDIEILSKRLNQISELDFKVIWPVHPRNKQLLSKIFEIPNNIQTIEPLGRLEMLKAIDASSLLITDSGGLQKEAYWALKPCFTLRSNTEWTETVSSGWNVLVDLSPKSLKDNISDWKKPTSHLNHYGDGYAANNILSEIINF